MNFLTANNKEQRLLYLHVLFHLYIHCLIAFLLPNQLRN